MQAGTEFAMESCSRLRGFCERRSGPRLFFYETPLTRVVMAAAAVAESGPAFTPLLLGLRLEGVRSSGLELVPFSLGSGPVWFSFWGRFCRLWDSARDM